jgi:hypothetical protein
MTVVGVYDRRRTSDLVAVDFDLVDVAADLKVVSPVIVAGVTKSRPIFLYQPSREG